jgi:hypothetical protein
MTNSDPSDDTEEYNFTLDEVTFPVKINGENYLLVEADAGTAERYKALTLDNVVMTQGHKGQGNKIERLTAMAQIENFVVSRCLKKIDAAGARHDVSIETIKKWPNRVVRPLYDKISQISSLTESDEEKSKAKN